MGAVRGRGNRTTELRLRMALVQAGISGWSHHRGDIPGKPDFFFERARLAIFVDGCFWHGCVKCGHIPKTNQAFWSAKINRNRQRHREVQRSLRVQGIATLRFWEHQLRDDLASCVKKVSEALLSTSFF
jgi:DNA mismatch endonuclease, patch repair protein